MAFSARFPTFIAQISDDVHVGDHSPPKRSHNRGVSLKLPDFTAILSHLEVAGKPAPTHTKKFMTAEKFLPSYFFK
jgi:hypothetical protein